MPIESSVTKSSDLNASYPLDADGKNIGANHLRNIKTAMKYFQGSEGASEVNTSRAETGAASRTVRAKLREWLSPEDFGCAGDGTTDDTTNFQKALDVAKRVRLTHGATYKITASVTVPTNGGIVGDGSQTIYMAASGFTNTAIVSTGSTCVGINCNGGLTNPYTTKTNILLEGFKVQCEVGDSRYLIGIAARNVNGIKIKDVELYGFPLARVIQLDSVNGDSELNNVYIHTCTTAVDWTLITASPQLTGIAIDGSRVNSVASTAGLRIINPRIKNLTFTGTALSTHGFQTDGINIEIGATRNVQIVNPYIENVGECIDIFGNDNTIIGGQLIDGYNAGVKFIHGASNNVISGTRIIRPGIYGVCFESSDSSGNVTNNLATGVTVEDVNPNAVWTATGTAGFMTRLNGSPTYTPQKNRVVGCKVLGKTDKVISSISRSGTTATLTTSTDHGLSTGMTVNVSGATPAGYNGTYKITVTGATTFTYVMLADPGGSASVVGVLEYSINMGHAVANQTGYGNSFDGVEANAYLTGYSSVSGGEAKVRTGKRTSIRAYLGSNATLSAGGTLDLVFDTKTRDTNGEFSVATGTYTASGSKRLLVKASMRLTATIADEDFSIIIRHSGSNVAENELTSGGNYEYAITVSDVIHVERGDTIVIRLVSAAGVDRTISGLSRFTFVTIEEL